MTVPSPRASASAGATHLLDNLFVQALFAGGFPVCFFMLSWSSLGSSSFTSVERRRHFELFGREATLLVLASVVVFFAWRFSPRRTLGWSRIAAPLLTLGCALAAVYAGAFLLGLLRYLWPPSEPDLAGPLTWAIAILMPGIGSAVFFRQAALAWGASGTRAAIRPMRATAMGVLAVLCVCALGVAAHWQLCEAVVRSLRSDRPDAIESAVVPLRAAIFLGGEDRLLRLGEDGDDTLQSRFDEAFRRVTGHTASERLEELSD